MILYGIKNCNTVKKTIAWFNSNNIPFEFHDYKKRGISENKLREWSRQIGAQNLLNRKGTTWRKFDEAQKEAASDENQAIGLMAGNTSVIRRPIVEINGKIVTVGYDPNEFVKKFLS